MENFHKILYFLIIGVTLNVGWFSYLYLQGEKKFKKCFVYILGLSISMLAAIYNLNTTQFSLFYFMLYLGLANFFLIGLLCHNKYWRASLSTAVFAGWQLSLGFIVLFVSSWLLTQEFHMVAPVFSYQDSASVFFKYLAVEKLSLRHEILIGLIVLAAMVQSAIWPFHKWLLSSLNAPTPASAMMHAGIINAGGIILVMNAPLLLMSAFWLQAIFLFGAISVILGTAYKLIQPDIKRTLACSTMAQMGYMFIQCGLGLFPAAIAHMVLHGFFKSYMFLASGQAALPKPKIVYEFSVLNFILATVIALFSAYGFSLVYDVADFRDGRLLNSIIVFLSALQIVLVLLANKTLLRTTLAIALPPLFAVAYAYQLEWFEHMLSSLNVLRPQHLNILHYGVFSIMVVLWFVTLLTRNMKSLSSNKHWQRLYVWLLNGSQPKASTITAFHNGYRYS